MVSKKKRKKLREKYQGERVLSIKKDKVNFNRDIIPQILQQAKYYSRYKMEQNPDYIQVIPYIVIFSPDKERVFVTKRTENSGEELLYNKLSLGIGGHINPVDDDSEIQIALMNGLKRELDEEVKIKGEYELKYQKIIYSDEDLVSQCHVGLLYYLEPKTDNFIVKVKETDKLEGDMVEIEKLKLILNGDIVDEGLELEEWAKIALQKIIKNEEDVNE